VEIIGYLDLGRIFPGIMTGNTVQSGFAAASVDWARTGLCGLALALFRRMRVRQYRWMCEGRLLLREPTFACPFRGRERTTENGPSPRHADSMLCANQRQVDRQHTTRRLPFDCRSASQILAPYRTF
jgi:hypothetical protein